MRNTIALMIVAVMTAFAGCNTQRAERVREDGEPCAVLSAAEIETVQGELVSSAKGFQRTSGPFITSQCFYTLPTYNRSVNVDVMRAGNITAATDFWNARFHKAGPDNDEEAAERQPRDKNSALGRQADEEREKERPQAVSGIGDEAFWAGTQVNGSLYVLQNSHIVRVSIGGPDDQLVKIDKAKSLAEKVLSRL